jgi:hypothetical protein
MVQIIISKTKEPVSKSGIVTAEHHQYQKLVTGLGDFNKMSLILYGAGEFIMEKVLLVT